MQLRRGVLSLALLLMSSVAAHACTTCDSPTAHHVRTGIFNGHFVHTFALVTLPFPVLALAVLLVHFFTLSLEPAAS